MKYKIDFRGFFRSILSRYGVILNLIGVFWLLHWGFNEIELESYEDDFETKSSGKPAVFVAFFWWFIVVLGWLVSKRKSFIYRDLDPKYKVVLSKYFEYYHKLSDSDKELFELRVQKFIDKKEFIPRADLNQVTDEMKAMIAGTAIQITFGYPNVYFEHFKKILVYNDNYYSNITQKYHQGEVNMRGLIVLSWNNFVRGFADKSDGRNLGFHEMAHALKLENAIRNGEYDFIDFNLIKEFEARANFEIDKMSRGEPSFFRDYASSNTHEFFAVLVENFFERPEALKKNSPAFYKLAADILRQDPLKPLGKRS